MDVPDWLHPRVVEILEIELQSALSNEKACSRRSKWAVVLGLKPMLEGNKWCLLWGEDIQSGIAAFGDTPEQAIENFELAMKEKAR